jgi:hypothetical protein
MRGEKMMDKVEKHADICKALNALEKMEPRKGTHNSKCNPECICMKCANDKLGCCYRYIRCHTLECPDFVPEGDG